MATYYFYTNKAKLKVVESNDDSDDGVCAVVTCNGVGYSRHTLYRTQEDARNGKLSAIEASLDSAHKERDTVQGRIDKLNLLKDLMASGTEHGGGHEYPG